MTTDAKQLEFDNKLLKILKFNLIPERKADSEKLAAVYIHSHRYDPRLKRFFQRNYNVLEFENALRDSSVLTSAVLSSKTLFDAIGELYPKLWPEILKRHMSRYPAFLQQFNKLGHYNEILKLTLNPIDPINKEFEGSSAEIPKDDAKKRFEDAEAAPRAAPRAEPNRDRAEPHRDRARPHRGEGDKAAGSASGFTPKLAMPRPSEDVPKPAQPKREFSDFERAMGREDYLDTRAYHGAMEERKQHQESKIKNLIKNM